MSKDDIVAQVKQLLKAEGFSKHGKGFLRSSGDIVQFVSIHQDVVDGRKYIEYSIKRNGSFLLSGRADRIFDENRFEIISYLSGHEIDGEKFDFKSWFLADFIPILNEMKSYSGVCELSRSRLAGKALISAEVRASW